MPNIALIAPTSLESGDLRREFKTSPDVKQGVISKGYLHGKSVVFSHCGVGKVNAAHLTTLILERNDIDYLILFGVGGAYSDAVVGDVVVARNESYGEEGMIIGEGWKPMDFTGFALLKKETEYFNTFPMDRKLMKLAINASKDISLHAICGNFITVSQCSGTSVSGEIMQKRFNGLCENMEGAAVAHICAIYGIPMVEIRGISNMIEDRNLKKWNVPLAASNCNKAVSEIIKRL
ncbi:MAG: futalosine hydrolase [Candidatus Methanoperedenaceae archaeon]|nr:MAG: futalosine hydrolase [Candidatus Methanoperedenaceae archaeon]